MKKHFMLAVVFALVFSACGDGNTIPNPDDPDAEYNIGDTGPGGGIVFFAEGGQYKECSGELGSYNWNDAITIAKNYKGNGFTDWHLPDRAELGLMYSNLHQKSLGGFSGAWYWTSVATTDASFAYYHNFSGGYRDSKNKSTLMHVRAVRSFTIETAPTSTLAINNLSDYNLLSVEYASVPFGDINSGKDVTKGISAGTRYVYFTLRIFDSDIRCRIEAAITCEEDKKTELTITNNTVITTTVDTKTNSLKNTFDIMTAELSKPQITVKQNTAAIEHYGEYDFGTVLIGITREITFSIENTGRSNLTLELVNANKINLADNASGYYTVNLQPLSPTVAPGDSVSFTIRFNPTTGGNNFAATVQIKTNSRNNNEFVFRVKGNSSKDYQIGDEGPGGGMIFYTGGGQYKECSGELGASSWGAAITTAQNYRGGGYTNWQLPDRGELDLMYRNLHLEGLGGFLPNSYWTSVRDSSGYYYTQNFTNGNLSSYYSGNSYRVRAVRTFYIFIN